jgi:CheY-like chemotaxis protein
MPDGGTLTIVTSNVDIGDDQLGPAAAPAGRYARLTVRDTGQGMTPETLQRAIEPFFTTKGHGHGTGLGLATVYGIVNQLGGVLRIESTPGRGAVVTIYLPTTDQPIETPPYAFVPVGGTETLLIAEDEDSIRDTLTRILTKAGYTLLTAANAVDALAQAEQHPHPIHLLLTDVIMPGMLGDELATLLHRQRPDTKILFMSGYAGDLMTRYGVLETGVTILPKPFTNNELLTAIRTAIGVPQP